MSWRSTIGRGVRRLGWGRASALVGVLVVAGLVHALGPAHIMSRLRQIGVGFGWVLAAYLLANIAYALPLGLALPAANRPTMRALVASRLAAVSVNAATPFLGVGGEPVRLLWLRAGARESGVAALVIDRSAFLGASALFLLTGVAVATSRFGLPPWLRVGLGAVALSTVAASLGLYLGQRYGRITHSVAWLFRRLPGRVGPTLVDRAGTIDQRIRWFHRRRPIRFPAAVALHLMGRLVSTLEVLVAARFLGLGVGLGGALVWASVPLIVDLVFSMVPSQIGVHESTSALLAAALGFDPAAGVAVAFVQRLRQVVFVSLGFVLLATRRGATRAASETNASPRAR